MAVTEDATLWSQRGEVGYRVSPVFPLRPGSGAPDLRHCTIHFLCFDSGFRVLGRAEAAGSDAMCSRLYYSLGLASVVLFASEPKHYQELLDVAECQPRSWERWVVVESSLTSLECGLGQGRGHADNPIDIPDYGALPVPLRASVDEFLASMAVIAPKVAIHLPRQTEALGRLVGVVRGLVTEAVFLAKPEGPVPGTLSEFTPQDLDNALLRGSLMQQAMDRLVQINSSLSYVSTQALSGAIPVLERRSVVRRYSLLGVGTAVTALTRLSDAIERAFAAEAVEHQLSEQYSKTPGRLPGTDVLWNICADQWSRYSVDALRLQQHPSRKWDPKLPHFSGRLGFRESEYSVSAAIQSLWAGGSMQWSLLTVSHEMVHGHVRNLLCEAFRGVSSVRHEPKWAEFYRRFAAHARQEPVDDETLIDSIRAVLLAYCCRTRTDGSLTSPTLQRPTAPEVLGSDGWRLSREFLLLHEGPLRKQMAAQYRNISEIMVHVLDLRYFYSGNVGAYVPLIWSSWAEKPQVREDLLQYVLRTLLTVAVKRERGRTARERYDSSVSLTLELLQRCAELPIPGVPVIQAAIDLLRGKTSQLDLYWPFQASLALVDMADRLLYSEKVSARLVRGDPLVAFEDDGTENRLVYQLGNGFVDDRVRSPSAYLVDLFHRQLDGGVAGADLEAATARMFLACCSDVT